MRYEKIHLNSCFPELGEQGADPVLELYLPENLSEMHREEQKRPCLVVLPGGAYAFCSRREAEPIALHFLPEGFNVFVLTYSTAPLRFPTQLREVAAVMELIYRHQDDWNCDAEQIVLMGFSAGGHLAGHYATQYQCNEVRQLFPNSKGVQAAILSYPVVTADPSFSHRGSFVNLLGHEPDEQEVLRFSNHLHVSDQTPPTFLWHTSADGSVPVKNSLVFANALAEHKIPFELHIYPYGVHGLATSDAESCQNINADTEHDHQWLAAVKRWLKTYIVK